ncbi:hypothetical protein D3C86_1624750 [compost metagenome]
MASNLRFIFFACVYGLLIHHNLLPALRLQEPHAVRVITINGVHDGHVAMIRIALHMQVCQMRINHVLQVPVIAMLNALFDEIDQQLPGHDHRFQVDMMRRERRKLMIDVGESDHSPLIVHVQIERLTDMRMTVDLRNMLIEQRDVCTAAPVII